MSKQKIIFVVLLFLITIFSFLSWQSLDGLLFGKTQVTASSLIGVAVEFLVVGALFGLLILFTDALWLAAVAALVNAALFILAFGLNIVYLLGLAVIVGFSILAAHQTKKEKKLRIKIAVGEILKPAMTVVFTCLAIIIALVLYFSPPVKNLAIEIKVPRPLFDLVLNKMIETLKGQLEGGLGSGEINLMIPGLPEINMSDLNKALGAKEVDVDKILGQEAKDNLYNLVNERINFFLGSYRRYLPYGVAIAAFFALKAVSVLFALAATFVCQFTFFIMQKTKLANIKKEMVEKETIEI